MELGNHIQVQKGKVSNISVEEKSNNTFLVGFQNSYRSETDDVYLLVLSLWIELFIKINQLLTPHGM
jgi:hypothetical protein